MDEADAGTGGGERAVASDLAELEALRAEVARLRAEQAELQSQLGRRPVRGDNPRLRRSITALLAGVCCVLIFLSALTVWIHQTAISTSGFVQTVAPIVDRPAVTQTLSVELTDQIFAAIDLEHRVAQILPAQGQFVAGPLTGAVQNFVQEQVAKVLASPQFRTVWITILTATHREVIAALRGQSQVLTISNGQVVLNTLPLVDLAMQQIQSVASGLFGRNITIPKVTSLEVPAQIRTTLAQALGVQLPSDFGQIELAQSSSLDVAKESVQLLDLFYWLLPLLTLLLLAATLTLSPTRRRTALQILIGTAVALIVERRAESWLQSRLIASLDPANRQAGATMVRQVLSGLDTAVWWALFVALVAVILLLISGPYRWARHLRSAASDVSGDVARAVAHRSGDSRPTMTWIVAHHRLLQVTGAVVGGLLLWVSPGWWFFVVAILLAGYEVALWRAGSAHHQPAASPPSSRAHEPPGPVVPIS